MKLESQDAEKGLFGYVLEKDLLVLVQEVEGRDGPDIIEVLGTDHQVRIEAVVPIFRVYRHI